METVVICDDDTVVRAAISSLCAEAGLEVVAETNSGTDAAEMVRRFGVDVLVLDLSLSDGSGEQTLATLEAEGTQAAVIVFTPTRPTPPSCSASAPGRWSRSPTSSCWPTCWPAWAPPSTRPTDTLTTAGSPAARWRRPRRCGAPRPACRRTTS